MPAISFSPLGYLSAAWRDTRAAFGRVARDRAALAAILLFVLPWLTLFVVRDNFSWLQSFVQIVLIVLAFWWLSRSGAQPVPFVRQPMLEACFAMALAFLWVEWRTGICGELFPFLPDEFECFNNWAFEIVPKLVVTTAFPLAVFVASGYGLHDLGLTWSWRTWWIALPALVGVLVYGVVNHSTRLMGFFEGTGSFFMGAGLPEEFLFRAILLTRLEAWWRSPGWALFGAAAIFGLSHIAIDYLVFSNRDWRETWITLLTVQMGFGYAFGFMYQRARNIWPLALLHAMVNAL